MEQLFRSFEYEQKYVHRSVSRIALNKNALRRVAEQLNEIQFMPTFKTAHKSALVRITRRLSFRLRTESLLNESNDAN